MSTAAMGMRPSRVRRVGTAELVALVGTAAWLFLAWSVATGRIWLGEFGYAVVEVVLPLAAGAFAVLNPERCGRAGRLIAAAMVVNAVALMLGLMVGFFPLLPAVVAVLIVASAACAAWPAPGLIAILALTGSYGTIQAYTPFSPGIAIDVLLVGLWGALLLGILVRPRSNPKIVTPGVALAVAYLIATFAALVFSPAFDPALRSFRASAWYMLVFLLIAYAGWKPITYRRIAYGVAFVGLLVGAYATLRWAIGPAAKERSFLYGQGADALKYNIVEGKERVFGSLPGGAELGAWAAVVMPFCVGGALAWRGRWRAIAATAVPLLAIALIGSRLRVALVAGVAGSLLTVAVFQLSRGFRGLRLGTTAVTLLCFLVAGGIAFSEVVGTNSDSTQRYRNILKPGRDNSWQERLTKWRTAMEDVEQAPLGHGIGTGGVQSRQQRFVTAAALDVDNSYLKVAYEQGFAVMVLFIITLFVLLFGLMRRTVWTRAGPPAAAVGACGSFAAFIIVLVTALFIEVLPALTAWIILGLGMAQFTSRAPAGDG
jgi:hypothetical protein